MSSSGLRERKKQKTRWAIQEHALRLFAQQGYDATTVEQIAAAAEVSPSTFFRYFPTKEDVVLDDEYDPMLISLVQAAPPELSPLGALRYAITSSLSQISAEENAKILARTRLQISVPALRARMLESFIDNIKMISGVIAQRCGRAQDDLELQTMAGACVGAMLPAIFAWAESDGRLELAEMVNAALTKLESGFAEVNGD